MFHHEHQNQRQQQQLQKSSWNMNIWFPVTCKSHTQLRHPKTVVSRNLSSKNDIANGHYTSGVLHAAIRVSLSHRAGQWVTGPPFARRLPDGQQLHRMYGCTAYVRSIWRTSAVTGKIYTSNPGANYQCPNQIVRTVSTKTIVTIFDEVFFKSDWYFGNFELI